jgi:hypothetical protein
VTEAAGRPVAAVVTDDPDAVRTVRHAARLAAAAERPLLLLVPLPGPRSSIDPALHRAAHLGKSRDAEAIFGRVAPALARHRGPVTARMVTYRACRVRSAGLTAVLRAAVRADADVLVTAARWAGRPGARGVVLLAPATGLPSSGQLDAGSSSTTASPAATDGAGSGLCTAGG